MLEELRDQVVAYLAAHRTCVLSVASPEGGRAALVRYRNHGLEVDCLLPRWSDLVYYLEQDPRVALVVPDSEEPLRWLRCWGRARILPRPDWAEWALARGVGRPLQDLYVVVRVALWRVDLLDEGRGWGVQGTWERGRTDKSPGEEGALGWHISI